jgi:hypothetical protein
LNGIKYAASESKTTGGMLMGGMLYLVYQALRMAVPAAAELPDGGEWLPAIMVGGPVVKETARNLRTS